MSSSTTQASEAGHTPDIIDLKCGAILGRRYRIERLLASGGMAGIYLAHDLTLHRDIALKVLSPELGGVPEVIEHFLNEARVMARLRGLHVARVFDCGRIQHGTALDLPFIVLELLDGVDLLTALQEAGRLDEAVSARYILETCEGLAEAHALGIVHRDIKPENLFLTRQVDGTYCVKLLDFGISKSLDDNRVKSLTQSKDLVGSPLYMSPEQMMALPLDSRTDIWALGAVMYECISGSPAFGAATVCEICARVLTDPMPSLRGQSITVSEAYVQVVERCLRRDPSDRFQDVAELAATLEPIAKLEGYSHAARAAAALRTNVRAQSAAVGHAGVIGERRANEATGAVGRRTTPRERSQKWPLAVSTAILTIGVLLGYCWHQYPSRTAAIVISVRENLIALVHGAGRHL